MTIVKFLKVSAVIFLVVAWVFSGWPSVWQNSVFPPIIKDAEAATETLSPDSIITQTNLSGSLTDIQDDPDSPDGNWLTAGQEVSTVAHVSFPTPAGNPSTGAGVQEFRILIRKTATNNGRTDDTYTVHLYDNGTEVQSIIATGSNVPADPSSIVVSATWDATNLTNADGSTVEAYITTTPETGGRPPDRGSIEVGAFEWNVDYTIPNDSPDQPTNSSPADSATDISLNPTLEGSSYSDNDGDSHADTEWRVDNNSDFSSPVWTRTAGSGEESTAVNSSNGTFANERSGETNLDTETQYYWQVRYSDGTDWSDWSSSTSFTTRPPLSFNQSAFRLFSNNDSTDVGSALASENTSATLTASDQNFRLRQLLHISGVDLSSSGENLKLQFADKDGGTCASPGGSYTDITTGTAIAYADNATPADGDALTDNANDPTHSGHTINNQTYEEANNFTNSESAITAGEDGLWDFSLTDNGAPEGATYCLRSVLSDGSTLSTYSQYPEVTTHTPPQPTFSAENFRFFSNQDGTDVGSALAAENTGATLISAGQNFRLRSLLHVSNAELAQSGQDFALEYADKTGYGSCSVIPDGDYAQVADTLGGSVGANWTEATSSADWSIARSHTSVVYDNKMWVMGGNITEFGVMSKVVWHSSDGVAWTQATTSVGWTARHNHTSVVYDNKIWVLGGADGSVKVRDVWYYASSTDSWTEATATADWSERTGHTSVVYDGKIWVLGGTGPLSTLNDVWHSSDGVNWTEATASSDWPARTGHTSVVYDGKIWVLGGLDGSSSHLNDVWHSSDGVNWTEATSSAAWSARNNHTSVVYDNKMWVIGGSDGSTTLNDVWYSTDGINWTEATASSDWTAREDYTSVVYDEKMWVLGGWDGSNRLNDVWHSSGGGGSTIAFNDNATPTDGDALTDNANDPTHSGHTINNQTYEEGNNFTNSESAITAGEDGLWDFSLAVSSSAPTSTTYCLRPTEADGTTLNTYNQYPEVTTYDGTSAVSVSISDGIVSYGTLSGDTASSTVGSDTQTASNDGSVTIDLNIQGQDTACPWTLASTTGIDQYIHEFSTDSGSSWTDLTTTYQTLATGIGTSGTQDFDLQVTTPTDSSCDTLQSVDVTVQAVQQ